MNILQWPSQILRISDLDSAVEDFDLLIEISGLAATAEAAPVDCHGLDQREDPSPRFEAERLT